MRDLRAKVPTAQKKEIETDELANLRFANNKLHDEILQLKYDNKALQDRHEALTFCITILHGAYKKIQRKHDDLSLAT